MSDDPILWIDLETSGVDEQHDPIIEVGAVLTEATPDLPIIAEFSRIARPPDYLKTIDRMDADVVDMHIANGLIRALLIGEGTTDLKTVEASLLIWLNNNLQSFTKRIPLAGSGVSHFDRRFIRAQMPKLDNRLTYWAYDVGSVRRFLRLYGLPIMVEHDAKTHRALDDVKAHIEEARYYGRLLRAEMEASLGKAASAA